MKCLKIFLFFNIIFLFSCSIHKREHFKGYYIEWNKSATHNTEINRNNHKETIEKERIIENSVAEQYQSHELEASTKNQNDSKFTSKHTYSKHIKSESSLSTNQDVIDEDKKYTKNKTNKYTGEISFVIGLINVSTVLLYFLLLFLRLENLLGLLVIFFAFSPILILIFSIIGLALGFSGMKNNQNDINLKKSKIGFYLNLFSFIISFSFLFLVFLIIIWAILVLSS